MPRPSPFPAYTAASFVDAVRFAAAEGNASMRGLLAPPGRTVLSQGVQKTGAPKRGPKALRLNLAKRRADVGLFAEMMEMMMSRVRIAA